MNKNKYLKPLLAVGALALLVIIMALVYNQLKPETSKGSKEVVVEVITPEEETKQFTLNTDAEYLSQALEEEQLIKGTAGDYGLFITEVNGRVVDDSKQEWWCITKDGEDVFTGVDATPIADGDHYEITLIVGY
jgi:Na+-translocating ferredoxin:NAD+ oxidoreductase RnfG subunit